MRFLNNLISTFFKNEEDRKRLNKVVIPSFLIHFFAGILGLALIFVMTRGLGSRQYGVYSYSFSIVFIIVYLATFGLSVLTVRETPSLLSKGETGLWKGLYKWSLKLNLIICTSLAGLVAIFIYITTFHLHILKETVYTVPILLALSTIPLFGLMNYFTASLRGQNKIVLSLLPDNIIKPSVFLLSVGLLFVLSVKFNLHTAILINAIALGAGAIFAIAAFYKTSQLNNIEAKYNTGLWKITLKSLFLLTIITSVNARMDILMLGYLKDSSQVGIYSAADMLASKLTIFLVIMNYISAASISRMHTLEQKQQLQKMITKTSRWVMLISLPVFAIMVIFSKWIMSYFGVDFESGQMALIIICTGQIINIAFGPVGNFALMTGNQRFNIIFTSINILLNIVLNLILTPSLGINGTAISTAIALITWNAGMFLSIRKTTGVKTWIFG